MPLYEFLCLDCGKQIEILMTGSASQPRCRHCGATNLKKLLSAHSSLSGSVRNRLPGPGDTTCCGSTPEHASCAGPGSCCGK